MKYISELISFNMNYYLCTAMLRFRMDTYGKLQIHIYYRGERGELAPLFLIASSEVMLTARRL